MDCDCGNSTVVRLDKLRSGQITQCAACTRAQVGKRRQTHGHSSHPLYLTWKGMMDRCHDTSNRGYPKYGGRGIFVCDRWQTFENFVEDMHPRPNRTTIDRIDNDGPYSPENCRWASREQQANNTSRTVNITFRGMTRTATEWSRMTGIPAEVIRYRVRKGLPPKEVLKNEDNRTVIDGRASRRMQRRRRN